MNNDRKWMLMTYYCPTHGDSGKIEPVEIKKEEIRDSHFKKAKNPQELNESK